MEEQDYLVKWGASYALPVAAAAETAPALSA
jgi:hypothetical protein